VDVAGFGGAVAVDDDVPLRRYSLPLVTPPQVGQVLPDMAETHLGEIILPIVVDGSRNMPPPHLGTCLSGVLVGRPGVHQESGAAGQRRAHLVQTRPLRLKGLGRRSNRIQAGVPPRNWALLQLPLVVTPVEQVHLRIAKSSEQPGQEGCVDVPSLSRTVDDHRLVEGQAEAREQLTIGSRAQQLSRNAPVTRPQRLRIQVHRLGKVTLQVGEYIAADIHQVDRAFGLPLSQLIGRDQLGMSLGPSVRAGAAQENCPQQNQDG
jgi:hypothetical protein